MFVIKIYNNDNDGGTDRGEIYKSLCVKIEWFYV